VNDQETEKSALCSKSGSKEEETKYCIKMLVGKCLRRRSLAVEVMFVYGIGILKWIYT
jgi:hypothetical protein